MPEQPAWITKVNFIKFYVSNPCNFPWIVYVETAWPAVGNLAINILTFGMLDVVRGLFRPRGLRSKRHGRKGRKSRGGKASIPEFSDMIAKKIPGQANAAVRKVSQGVRTMWEIDNSIQKASYYWFIVDLVTDFAYDWMSGIVRDERSSCQNIGRMLVGTERHVFLSGGWGQLLMDTDFYVQGGMGSEPGNGVLPEGNFQCILSCDVRMYAPIDPETDVQLGMTVGPNSFDFITTSERITIKPGEKGELVASAFVKGPGRVQYRAITTDAAAAFDKVRFFAMQVGDESDWKPPT